MIAQRIGQLLAESGLTRQAFAKHKCGVSYNQLAKYVAGYAEPSEKTLARIARTCGVTQAWIRGESEDRNESE